MGTRKGINSRNKGANGEREFTKDFLKETGVELKRNYEQSASGGHDFIVDTVDSVVSQFVDRAYSIECKRVKRVKESDKVRFLKQASKQAKAVDKVPIVVYREDYGKWHVICPIFFNGTDYTIHDCVEFTLPGFSKFIEYEARVTENESRLHDN